ncbi:hypothetical protein BKG60_02140 [Mycobacterium syngnathidarum]|nr:hypothetical protein BKG60_02140 [Mycobacterium syngnathidarum]
MTAFLTASLPEPTDDPPVLDAEPSFDAPPTDGPVEDSPDDAPAELDVDDSDEDDPVVSAAATP